MKNTLAEFEKPAAVKKEALLPPFSKLHQERVEAILKDCEGELIQMSLVKPQGGEFKNIPFQSPIFRFIWLKLTERLRKEAPFDSKGMRHE